MDNFSVGHTSVLGEDHVCRCTKSQQQPFGYLLSCCLTWWTVLECSYVKSVFISAWQLFSALGWDTRRPDKLFITNWPGLHIIFTSTLREKSQLCFLFCVLLYHTVLQYIKIVYISTNSEPVWHWVYDVIFNCSQ